MWKILFTLCAASAALLAPAAPSRAATAATDGIVLETPIPGVNLITVAVTEEIDADIPADHPPVVINNVTIVIAPPNRRLERLRRVFGHRYPGFIKMYAGPRYPF